MDDGKRKLAVWTIIVGIPLAVFAIIGMSTAKPSTFSCSRAAQTCTWVHTNAIGWTSSDTFQLADLRNSHMNVHQDPRGRSVPSHVWVVDAGAGYLDLAAVEEGSPLVAEYAAYAKALQRFFDDPARQTFGLTLDPDPGAANAFALLLCIGVGIAIGGFCWRRGSDIRIVVDRESRTVRMRRSPWVREIKPIPFDGLTIETAPFTAYALGEGDRQFLRVTLRSHFKPMFTYKVMAGWNNSEDGVDRMRRALEA